MTMKVMNKHNRDLPVTVSEAVRNDAGRDASTKIERIRVLEEEIASYATPRKKEIKDLREEAGKLAHVSATGQRVCPVACEEIWDIRRDEKFVKRTDTNETVDGPTPLTEAERKKLSQGEFEFEYETDDEEPESRPPTEPSKKTSADDGESNAAPADDSDKLVQADAAPANANGKGKKGGKRSAPRVKLP